MKVKLYGLLHLKDCDEWRMCEMAGHSGTHVLATDYDALLALARRLRKSIVTTDDITVLVETAWLEE